MVNCTCCRKTMKMTFGPQKYCSPCSLIHKKENIKINMLKRTIRALRDEKAGKTTPRGNSYFSEKLRGIGEFPFKCTSCGTQYTHSDELTGCEKCGGRIE